MTLALRIIPGRPVPELMLVNPKWTANPLGYTEDVQVVLSPAAEPIKTKAVSIEVGVAKAHAVMIDGLPEDFLDRFSSATTLAIKRRGKELASIGFTGSAKAVQALRDCNDGLLKAWGADPQELASLRSFPIASLENLFKSGDYPEVSIRAGTSGTVVVRFTVNTMGRVSDCTVVGPSGDAALDQKTCSIFETRARFSPGIGQDGAPKPVKLVQTVHWALAEMLHPRERP